MDEWLINDGPDDYCFGCGQRNEGGLKLRFRKTGDASVETVYTPPKVYQGAPGVVHGGIQATLIDEVMGMAAHVGLGHDDGRIVTAELKLRYPRPTPTDVPLTVRGRLVRRDGSHLFLEAQICDADGQLLTEAEARWRHFPEERWHSRRRSQGESPQSESD
jgi:uncharacterized protein (TIGR00369 family)